MITVKDKRSKIGQSLDEKLARLNDLAPADNAARRAVVKQNKALAFRMGHRASHVSAENGRVEIGSRAPGYFKLLRMNGEFLADLYAAYIVTGSVRG